MKNTDVTDLLIDFIKGDDLPHRVEIVGKQDSVKAAGATLSDALLAAFSESGFFPNNLAPYCDKESLAAYLFWRFNVSKTWLLAIRALERRS